MNTPLTPTLKPKAQRRANLVAVSPKPKLAGQSPLEYRVTATNLPNPRCAVAFGRAVGRMLRRDMEKRERESALVNVAAPG